MKNSKMKIAFIIGSHRSGTTILGNILNQHPEISEWYEPYYLWERYFPCKKNDIWPEEFLNEKTKGNIHKEYTFFHKKAKKPIILEKSPGHEFNLNIIHQIFHDAKWIHVLRDGRDVTLSIKKEWERRARLVKSKDFMELFRTAQSMLKRQPFWRYRMMAIFYELRTGASLNPLKYFNKSRWGGEQGWGNRFKGWEEYLQTHSSLQFNAMQWVKSVEAVQKNWDILPEENRIEITYEDLLTFPEEALGNILETLKVEMPPNFLDIIPTLKKNNFHKWNKEFSREEIREMGPILTEKLLELGYEKDPYWADTFSEQENRR